MKGARAARRPAVAPRRGPGRPPGPSQAAQLRERLLAEASALYAAGGSASLSFGALAERTGLSKPTLFHYFPNKDALHWAVFQRFGERLEAATAGWFEPPPASHAARLDRVVGSLVQFYGADPLNARILCHGLLEAAPPRPSALAGPGAPPVFADFVQRFAAFVAAGSAAGEFHPDRPLATVLTIGGIILFEFMLPDRGRIVYGDTAVPLAERRRELTALVRRAVVRPAARLRARRSTTRRTAR